MTQLGARLTSPAVRTAEHPETDQTVVDMIVRLRETAGRMMAFSSTKLLLRQAAASIERLDGDRRTRVAEIAALHQELKALRDTPRSS